MGRCIGAGNAQDDDKERDQEGGDEEGDCLSKIILSAASVVMF